MTLNSIKLGKLIQLSDERNDQLIYGINNVKGISVKKEFIETKADMNNVSLKPYKVVKKDYFAYVPITSRNSNKITIAHNTTDDVYIVSSSYIVFKIINPEILDSDYLFMYFNRPEFDRYARYNSWGSAREAFSWQEMCDIEMTLPSMEMQKKVVAIYKAMIENQNCYDTGIDDLKLVCDAYIENLRRNSNSEKIGNYIVEKNIRNIDYVSTNVKGVENSNCLTKTKADINGLDFRNYKIVSNGNFVYNPSRINIGSIALSNEDLCIVSPMYTVFEIIDNEILLPEYLMMWLTRTEFFRSTKFYASGSVRDSFNFSEMKEVKIPIPSLKQQQYIVNVYKTFILRKNINEKLKEQIKNVCSILIKGSLE